VLRHVPVAASYSRTVLLLDADAASRPSGEKATTPTEDEWFSSVLRHVPVVASHSHTVLSHNADASALSKKTVQQREAATGTYRSTLEGHSSSVGAVAFSPDGRLVASASGNNTVRLWEAATGTCRSTLEDRSSQVRAEGHVQNSDRSVLAARTVKYRA
jgi:WD40 repeat protein